MTTRAEYVETGITCGLSASETLAANPGVIYDMVARWNRAHGAG